MALLAGRRLPRAPEGRGGPVRARVRGRGERPELASPAGPRAPLPPELLSVSPPRRHPPDAPGALDPDRGRARLRLRGHADLRGPGLRLLDDGRPARPRGLEDGEPRPRGDRRPAGRLRPLRPRHPRGLARARGPPRGEPP